MRLAQLARKLSIRPSQIIDFLAMKQVFPEEGSNARLTHFQTEQIIAHFAPEKLNELIAQDGPAELILDRKAENQEPAQNEITESNERLNATEEQPAGSQKPEVIKAPKVELSGLKVLGKIELKEPRKKVSAKTDAITPSEEITRPIRKGKKDHSKKTAVEKSWLNPIAIQREKEAREAEERRKEQAAREKERRTLHYLKKVKPIEPARPLKIYQDEKEPIQHQTTAPPKTWLGRLLKWLNN
jgi:hypothetical protein